MVLNLIIAEAALELVPAEISGHASARNEARRRGIKASETLLDRSIHHHAMLKLREGAKRGRPDLVQLTLLSVTSTPLYLDEEIKLYIHTNDNTVLELERGTRPPKSYARFRDLVQKLLVERPKSGLISVHDSTLSDLIDSIHPDLAVGLSTQGKMTSFEALAVEVSNAGNPAILVGGFPKGHFEPETVAKLDELVRIHRDPLDAHVVTARLIYALERTENP